jgi:hypothetical protein
LLRYKITGIFGNINAFNWMTQPENIKRNNSSQAAKLSHKNPSHSHSILARLEER